VIVIGPERLPRTARMLGHLFGRLQRYVNEVKADINREMELDELRRLQREVKTAAGDLEQSVRGMATDFEANVRSVQQELNAGAAGFTSPSSPADAPQTSPQPPSETAPRLGGASEPPQQASLPGLEKL
jgi:sec-independent protein translocase protein TatB